MSRQNLSAPLVGTFASLLQNFELVMTVHFAMLLAATVLCSAPCDPHLYPPDLEARRKVDGQHELPRLSRLLQGYWGTR
uniref:Uncharacterized protein n=1 Tax=Arundo donax TaxID=35708 RepID=A0A0A9EH49_ARUDO